MHPLANAFQTQQVGCRFHAAQMQVLGVWQCIAFWCEPVIVTKEQLLCLRKLRLKSQFNYLNADTALYYKEQQ